MNFPNLQHNTHFFLDQYRSDIEVDLLLGIYLHIVIEYVKETNNSTSKPYQMSVTVTYILSNFRQRSNINNTKISDLKYPSDFLSIKCLFVNWYA